MRPRYSFSSRKNRKTENIRKQKQKYPNLADKIIEMSDIILEILDARFIEESRNLETEEKIKKLNKKLIFVINKSDLIKNKKNNLKDLNPKISISCKSKRGITRLRSLIKQNAAKIKPEKIVDKDKSGKVAVGVIGYPNTGKSSLINLLIGKKSAGVGSDAGFTKGLQKIKLTTTINLIDSPGVISKEDYSSINLEKIAKHTKLGARSFSQVKEPEMVIHNLMKEFGSVLEKFYKIKADGDSEILIEELGKRKGFMKKGNNVDEDKTARLILEDWQKGKIKV